MYQATTESLDSLDQSTCAPRLTRFIRRNSDQERPTDSLNSPDRNEENIELDVVEASSDDGHPTDEHKRHLARRPTPSRTRSFFNSFSTPSKEKKSVSYADQVSCPTKTLSGMQTGSDIFAELYDSQTSVDQPKFKARKLSRAKSVRRSISQGTKSFFGLTEEEKMQQKWRERRMRHCSKYYGKMKDQGDATDFPSMSSDAPGGRTSVFSSTSFSGGPLRRRVSRRESVPRMMWKGLRRQMSKAGEDRTASLFRGRSFAPADLVSDSEDEVFHEEEEDEFDDNLDGRLPSGEDEAEEALLDNKDDDQIRLSPYESPRSPSAITAPPPGGFFTFINDRKISVPSLDGKHDFDEEDAIPVASASPTLLAGWRRQQREKALERERELLAKEARIKPIPIRHPSERRHRLQNRPIVHKRAKRELGKGLVGRMLNTTFRRQRFNSRVRKQMDEIEDHRPYFTYWVTFVQVVVLIVLCSVYKFAPVGISKRVVTDEILLSRHGVLQKEKISKVVFENFWIGPSREDLILLGAKYAPCMRRDKLLWRTLDQERIEENRTGCCMQTYSTSCVQTARSECLTSFTKFLEYTKDSKVVCGQDPIACSNPRSVAPYEWPPYDITKWPICVSTINVTTLSAEDYPHLRCEVTGRPCCIGTQARCIITSREHCSFLGGKYQEQATLCSQVDCLTSACGLLPFLKANVPDQIYRLWLSLFLHAGIIHILITILFNFTVLRDVEKLCGWLRIGIIYLLSGMGGNLWSSVLIPYEAEVGPSGALFGVIACLFVELFQSWQIIAQPFIALLKLSFLITILFLIGMLPYVDNFAHLFGFTYGLLLAFALLPYVSFGLWDLRRKRIQIVIACCLVIAMTAVGCILFYAEQEFNCAACEYLNCLPLTSNFCENFHIGQKLQSRSFSNQ